MAERLGEALLDLRTNDAAFNAGIAQAEGRAQKLGSTLDKTSGSSAKLAGEMVATGRSAAQMGAGFEQAGQRVSASADAQRAGMQQLGFQLGDIATMYSLGARPAQIFASQIGQVTQAVQLMAGGTSRVAAFLGGPWGIGLSVATIALAPFIGKLFEAEDALEGVEFASDKLGDAQGILGSVIDLTTGKIKEQTAALWANARAQADAGLVQAERERAQARSDLEGIRRGEVKFQAGFGGGLGFRRQGNGTEDIITDFQNGNFNASFAIRSLRSRRDAGMITDEAFLKAIEPIQKFEMAGRNIETFDRLNSALEGDQSAVQSFLDPRSPRQRRERKGPRERTEAQKQEDFGNQSFNIERETLQARLQLATGAEERATIQSELLALEREQRIAEVEASDLGRQRKDALIAQIEELLGTAPAIDEQGNLIVSANRGLEGILISRERARQQARDEQDLADVRFSGAMDMLQNQMALADTQVAQKIIALRIYDAQVEEERIRLQKIIDLEAIGAATAEEANLARQRLANLNANAAGGREAVARGNETSVERYLRGLNQTPAQINEAIDGISIDGLEALNDGITDAIMGAESLGDMFDNVADQIISALLRIAIQQAIIRPLSGLLFGGGGGGDLLGSGGLIPTGGGGFDATLGGGGGGLLGSIGKFFAGFFATGGTIPTGQFGIVGEEGPEIAVAGPGGLGILSNSDSRKIMSGGGGTSVSIPITIDATGADAAAIARVNASLDQLRAELPGKIVSTVQDASNRRIINMGGGR